MLMAILTQTCEQSYEYCGGFEAMHHGIRAMIIDVALFCIVLQK
jgi:hypothetical protein